jgi:chromosomal replication initiator protein
MDIGKIWKATLPKIADKVSSISFDCWIKTLTADSFTDGTFVLLAESKNAKDYATNERHFQHIEAAVKDTAPVVETVRIIDPVEKEQAEPAPNKPLKKEPDKLTVNPNQTFENFIVGKSNEIVAAAAEGVAKNPGKRINPLFIYGGVGLGKTHLLNAIANHILAENSKLHIILATSEKFTNDYIYTIKSKDQPAEAFREKYRTTDILLIDDIQFIADKPSTQEEFFHTFNDLVQNGRQVVLTSDRHPDDMPKLQERMRSRFKSGLIQDIGSPDVEMRTAILQKKAAIENQRIDGEVIGHLAKIAADTGANIRDMEAMLFKVIFYVGLMNRTSPTIEDCDNALKVGEADKKVQTTADHIVDQVCRYFNVKKADIVGKRRNRELVEPRHFAMYLISECLNIPLVNIGQVLGNRDHSSVLHGRNKIQSLLATDSRVKMIVKDISKMVRSE